MDTSRMQADTLFSTYWWEIDLDPAKNRTTKMTGYSNFIGYQEAKDKDRLLCKKIEMLYNWGYFDRMFKADIHRREGHVINKSTDRCILRIQPATFDINASMLKSNTVSTYLIDFYKLLRTGGDVNTLLLKTPRATHSNDDHTDIDKQSLKIGNDPVELLAYCRRLSRFHKPEVVAHFYTKYQEKYLGGVEGMANKISNGLTAKFSVRNVTYVS